MRVKTAQISPIIKRYIEDKPKIDTRKDICKLSGIGERKLQSLIECDVDELIPFSLADKVMCAINRPEVFVTGEVEIILGES